MAPVDPSAAISLDAALKDVRILYSHGRSAEALSLARNTLDAARRHGAPVALQRQAATACGITAADTLDLVAAVDYHVLALRMALPADAIAPLKFWNNIGLAMGIGGHYSLAAKCYRRVLELAVGIEGRVLDRWVALMNLGMCLHRMGSSEEGLPFALRALEAEGPFVIEDPQGKLLLRRNLVAILVGCGRVEEARQYVDECTELGAKIGTHRARVATACTRAIFELAQGRTDVSLTRLDQALREARELPAALFDTLIAAIRAEEAAGQFARALDRVEELSQHVYRLGIERTRDHVELAHLDPGNAEAEREQWASRARLIPKLSASAIPEAWPSLERLAVSAVMRMDATGLHGKRVGALVKGLAFAAGAGSIQALEMGLAAELHDVGMLSVPIEILGKAGELSGAERLILHRHVEAGLEMLRDDREPRTFLAREIVRYHHARWDGQGDPSVGAQQIPLAARITTIADAYDAMVFGLGTTRARSMDEALKELKREAGRQFDPDLVATFVQLIHAESEDLGMDVTMSAGMKEFESLVKALQDDRGFI